ncbi:hypothetical protein TNCV_2653461 [Trichonephila clavipes]|nr:hypothetical protein TNCV_2653461 [Trichonephila clavipes]
MHMKCNPDKDSWCFYRRALANGENPAPHKLNIGTPINSDYLTKIVPIYQREIDSRAGRNQTTVMRICDRWMQEGPTIQRGRSHPPQCTTSSEWSVLKTSIAWSTLDEEPQTSPPPMDERRMWAAEWNEVSFTDESRICLQHHDRRIRVWRHREERMQTPALCTATLVLLRGLAAAIFQQDNARRHVARIVQRFFVNHQIELLPWPALSPDLSPIENMWSIVVKRLTQITPQLPHQINFGYV